MTVSETITLDHYRESLFMLLAEAFENVQGIFLDKGTSLFETLAGLSAETVSRPVSDTCSSIAAQVIHTRFYLDLMNQIARTGEQPETDWEATWAVTTVTPEEWDDLRAGLKESYESLKETLSTDVPWSSPYAVGGSMAILAHTAYHLGEIRQAMCTVGRN
jgi:hypothetical protein